MKRIVWLAQARQDLLDIAAYFAARDPRVGETLIARIEAAATMLAQRDIGRPSRVPDLRELSVVKTRYIIAYETNDAHVMIFRVIHASRHWPVGGWPKS